MNQTAPLGDAAVRRIGFGAMQLAGPGVFGPPADREAALAVLRRAVELGVDHIDTAQYYGPDVVNDLIRDALHPYPDGLRLATKVGAAREADAKWVPALAPEELRAGVEANLRSLRVERMHLVNLRLMAGEAPFDEQLAEMVKLREEGKLAHIGISNANRAQVEHAVTLAEIVGVQNAYSVLDRTHEDVVELCGERGLAFVPFFPLGSAFTGGPAKLAEHPAVASVAAKHGVTPAQVALAWLLHRGDHVLLIPGTGSVGHLEENLAAAGLELDGDDLRALG